MKLCNKILGLLERARGNTGRAIAKRQEKEKATRDQFSPFHKKLRKLNKKKVKGEAAFKEEAESIELVKASEEDIKYI